jgi:hypothetical protein
MKNLFLISAAAMLISTGAFAQSTVTTTATADRAGVPHADPHLRHRAQDPSCRDPREDRRRFAGAARRGARSGADRMGAVAD